MSTGHTKTIKAPRHGHAKVTCSRAGGHVLSRQGSRARSRAHADKGVDSEHEVTFIKIRLLSRKSKSSMNGHLLQNRQVPRDAQPFSSLPALDCWPCAAWEGRRGEGGSSATKLAKENWRGKFKKQARRVLTFLLQVHARAYKNSQHAAQSNSYDHP